MDKYAIAAFLIGLWIMCSWIIATDRPYQRYKRLRKERKARQTERWIQRTLPDSYDILDLLKGTEYEREIQEGREQHRLHSEPQGASEHAQLYEMGGRCETGPTRDQEL